MLQPKRVHRDGATGGGHKPWYADLDEIEPFVKHERGRDCGYRDRQSRAGNWTVIELDYWADPRKTEAWAKETEETIGRQRFLREYGRAWGLSTRGPYYPEFLAGGGREVFSRTLLTYGKGHLAVGLDFGIRRPAMLLAQPNARKTRLYCLREWMPSGLQAKPFMQVCMWLLGEYPKDKIEPEGLVHVLQLEREAEEGFGPPVPWLDARYHEIRRYASQEALRTEQTPDKETRERRVCDIWEAAGFPLNLHQASVDGGADVVRHLLRKPPKGVLPYLVVDPWCKLLVQGLEGGYTFRRPTRDNPEPSEPAKDGKFEHLQDCLKYIATNAIDIKVVDDGSPDGTQTAPAPSAEIVKPARRDPSVYSRDEVEADTSGCSTVFGESGRGDVYDREEAW